MVDFGNYPYPSRRMPVFARNVVATSQPLATAAGVEALRRGGNAMDAALATAIALTVVEPTSNGLGSDAFALIWAENALHGLNGSGRSPAAMDPARWRGLDAIPARGWDPVTVPGAVDAWVQCSRRFGRMPFSELFDAAIRYAEDGFLVGPVTAGAWERSVQVFGAFPAWADTFLWGGRAPKAGECVCLPGHAETLRLIAESEGEAFYRGALAEAMQAEARAHDAPLSTEDLAAHRSDWVEPLETGFADVTLHEIPPNGQGLAALIALGVLRHTHIRATEPDGVEFFHLQIEATRIGLAEAHAHVSDPATMRVPASRLLEESVLKRHAANIDPLQAGSPRSLAPADPGTVLLCAADDEGMMVSFIQSNYQGFGSGVVIPGTGIAMQNRGCGFSLEPGHPNEAAPGKRPFHTIIPGFATATGQPRMAFGVMGGAMQAQGHVQLAVRIFGFAQNPQAASDAPRWQVAEDGALLLEEGFPQGVAEDLASRGHKIAPNTPSAHFGGAQAILGLEDGYCAASDHRKDGCAMGF